MDLAPSAPASCRDCGVAILPGALTCREHSAATIQARGTTRLGATAEAPPVWSRAPGATPAWSPPPGAPRTASRSGGVGRLVVAVIVAAVVLAGGSYGYRTARHAFAQERADQQVADYLRGDGGQPFSAPDGTFRASFPNTPARSTQDVDMGGRQTELTSWLGGSDQTAFGVSTAPLPAGLPYDLASGLNGAAEAMKGTVESGTPTDFAGFPAEEGVISTPGGGHMKVLIVRTTGRLYIAGVSTVKDTTPPGYDTFVKSLELTAP